MRHHRFIIPNLEFSESLAQIAVQINLKFQAISQLQVDPELKNVFSLTSSISKPTTSSTELRTRLENEGLIKEYTMVPDFSKLGFNLLSLIMLRLNPLSAERIQELHRAAHELDNQERRPFLMIMSGMGLGKNLAILSFHKDYGAYAEYIRELKDSAHSRMKAFMDVEGTEAFLIDLNYTEHYQPLTFSRMATNLQTEENKSAPVID